MIHKEREREPTLCTSKSRSEHWGTHSLSERWNTQTPSADLLENIQWSAQWMVHQSGHTRKSAQEHWMASLMILWFEKGAGAGSVGVRCSCCQATGYSARVLSISGILSSLSVWARQGRRAEKAGPLAGIDRRQQKCSAAEMESILIVYRAGKLYSAHQSFRAPYECCSQSTFLAG